jgi:hypothetical protein
MPGRLSLPQMERIDPGDSANLELLGFACLGIEVVRAWIGSFQWMSLDSLTGLTHLGRLEETQIVESPVIPLGAEMV